LDKFGRYYAWFLLVATALPAIVRLSVPARFAEMTSERIADAKKRGRHRMLGWISVLGSFVLVPVYYFYSQQRWMIVAFVIGIITGFEMLANARSPEQESIRRQSIAFGVVYVVCCVFTYFFVLYRR
jgi:phosphatidylserine synthase